MKQAACLCVIAWMCIGSLAMAQQKIEDRRQFLDRGTPVSDDPRRVPVKHPDRGPQGTLVLRGGRVFDSRAHSVSMATLVIDGNHISRILAPGVTDWPDTARVIDVTGKTVLPGLIDLHTHLSIPENDADITLALSDSASTLVALDKMNYFIESGITSVRDMASARDVPFRLKQWVAKNHIPGPRVFAVGQFITGEGGHGAEGVPDDILRMEGVVRVASGADDWRQAVREQFHRGADLIKLGSHFSAAEVHAAVDEAHDLGLKVAVDAETFYIQRAVEAGADVIEHPLPRSDETIRLMAKNGVAADPTLVPYIIIFDRDGGYFGSTSRRFTFSKAANLEMLRRLKRAGVKCGVGTDLIGSDYKFISSAYVTELKQFVAAGWSVPEVLAIATRTNAEILDMGDRLGTLEPGKLADVLVVRGSPDLQLDDIDKVDLVIRDGYVVVEHGQIQVQRHPPAVDWSAKENADQS